MNGISHSAYDGCLPLRTVRSCFMTPRNSIGTWTPTFRG